MKFVLLLSYKSEHCQAVLNDNDTN